MSDDSTIGRITFGPRTPVGCGDGNTFVVDTAWYEREIERLKADHAAALAAKDAEIEALKLSLVRAAGWTEHDQPLPEDDAILAAFPVGTNRDAGRFATYAEAQRLVSAKRSKGALVDLVNWLLARAERAEKAEAEVERLRADAERYRVARAKVCIVGDAFHVINLRPTYVAPDAAIEFDAAIDAARGES